MLRILIQMPEPWRFRIAFCKAPESGVIGVQWAHEVLNEADLSLRDEGRLPKRRERHGVRDTETFLEQSLRAGDEDG